MKRYLTCSEVVELVTDYLEGALPVEERDRFERHIATCGACDIYLAQMRTTLRVTGALQSGDVEPEVMDALVGTFRAWRSSQAT